MRKALLLSFLLICLLVFPIPQAWAWSLRRPSNDMEINEHIHYSNTDGKASIGLGVHICEYYENWVGVPYDGNDVLRCAVVATSNSRKILHYDIIGDEYHWYDNLPNTLTLGDDECVSISDIYTFRFYGGVGSAEYSEIYVSSNGVIFLNESCTDPYYSANIPDPVKPNMFIAPFWRDLKPNLGGSITYGPVYHPPYNPVYCFCISWNSVPDKDGIPQTFQVIIERAPTEFPSGAMNYWQSRIWFQYKNVTLNDQTTIGIEDQEGYKGKSYNYLDLANKKALLFYHVSNYAVITGLTIELIENDNYAWIDIGEDPDWIRGENVMLQPDAEPDTGVARFAFALAEGATLLLGGKAGLIIGGIFWTVDVAWTLAEMLREAEPFEIVDQQPVSYAKVMAWERNYKDYPVDALFGIIFYWVFTDPNNVDHSLTINVKLHYKEYNKYGSEVGGGTIQTSAKLCIYVPTYDGGGCPTLFVWNGTCYVEEALLNIHGDSDVTVQHRIEFGELASTQNNSYPLSLRELDEYTSHIDYIKLYVVDEDGVWHECHLKGAIHNELGNVMKFLLHDDNIRVDLKPTQTINLKFAKPNISENEIDHFILEIQGYNPKDGVYLR